MGSPFVYAQYAGGEPVVTFTKAPEVFAGTEKDAVLGLRINKRNYALFAPTGSTWAGIGTTRFEAKTNGKGYFSLALLPDDQPATLARFKACAYNHVTGSKVSWAVDEKKGVVTTTFAFETKAMEGTGTGTLFALYPHQWRSATADLTGQTYNSVRGPLKLAQGRGFVTTAVLPPALPTLPLTPGVDKAKLKELLAAEMAGKPKLTGDTYWLGKNMGRWATVLPIAEQLGDTEAVAELDRRMRAALEDFFTATNASGGPDGKGVFAYDKNWGTLIGYPASYGSDDNLNDHHFHYGYFFRAAGEIARRDPSWAADAKWGAMLKLLLRDVASTDRGDKMFPFLRNFDPYAGHTWASGNAKFADGNNNESSSEAVNCWYGVMMLGEALGDRAMRDLGAWCFATEISAIEDYWFDVRSELLPKDYPASVVTMVWGGKGANGTWFSGEPEALHGINFLPVTGGSLYLGRFPDYAKKNYDALSTENKGTNWSQWADIIWMYRAVSDPADAIQQWEAGSTTMKMEEGNSKVSTYAWIMAFSDLGQIDRTVTADTMFAATFNKGGKKTHVAWNLSAQPKTVTFSDGTRVECAAKKFVMK